jgi:RNA polymerase sigma-70 factor (ECF subfamily)
MTQIPNIANSLQTSPEGSIAIHNAQTQQTIQQQGENADIAARLRNSDSKILDELIVRYQHRLLRYLIYLTGNRELSEDLFQETWMRVLIRGSQFRGNSQFVTWLFSIARNLVFDLKRKAPPAASFEEMTQTGDEQCFSVAEERSAFDYCAALENARLVEGALPDLSPQQREVILLRFIEDLPLLEIAVVTGAPLSTVKARLYRGLAVLKSGITRVARREEPGKIPAPSRTQRLSRQLLYQRK